MSRLNPVVLCLVACACKTPESAERPAPSSGLPMPSGLDESYLDPKTDPCNDFYRFACGGWSDRTEIPSERSSWGPFNVVAERNLVALRSILEQAAAGQTLEGTPYSRELGDFYASCIDVPKLEAALPELHAELARIDAASDLKTLTRTIARMQADGLTPLFELRSAPDFKNSSAVIGELDEAGIGLPDRDYYLSEDPQMKKIRELYRNHMEKMFVLLGIRPEVASHQVQEVMKIETTLAEASWTQVERRDPAKTHHLIESSELSATAPQFRWDEFLQQMGVKQRGPFNVTNPSFLAKMGKLLNATPIESWKFYLRWHLIKGVVPALPKSFQDEDFRFEGKILTGALEDRPRWKKCVALTDAAMGEALAPPFVSRTFGEEGKETTSRMVAEIEKALDQDIASLNWMDASTRASALQKLRAIRNKIGYPEKWKSYDGLQVDRASFLRNFLRADAFEKARDLGKIGKPLDRSEWMITPPTVNAYYEPPRNEIVFPAGILQPPFYNRQATYAVNFGAMGMVVGHEITHGFDDAGRHYDAEGNLKEWWTDASDRAFRSRASCVKEAFDNEIAIDSIHVNGELTLGENIADLGGLKLSHAALGAWPKRSDGGPSRFDDQQQFFLGFAQIWCAKYRPEYARQLALIDPHSPSSLRVNVTVRQLPAFQQAFHCKAGAKMAASRSRCEVW